MMSDTAISWEIPLSVIEDMFQAEFNLEGEIKITSCDYDEDADAVYVNIFTADSRDSVRFPESSIFGHRVD